MVILHRNNSVTIKKFYKMNTEKNVLDVPKSRTKSKNYSSEDHKLIATFLDSAAKLHKEAASYKDAGDTDKGNQSGHDADVHYTKAGEIDQRYTAAKDHETSAHHYAKASTHRKNAAMHTQVGNHSKAKESNTKANKHLTKAGEIDRRYKKSNDYTISANHYDQASTHRKEAGMHTRKGDHTKAMQSHAQANEHLTKAGEIDKSYTLDNSTKGTSKSSKNEKHPQDANGQFVSKNHSANGTSNSSQNEKHPQDANGQFVSKN